MVEVDSRVVSAPDPTNPYEWSVESDLVDQFESWKATFMIMLLDHYAIYKQHGLRVIQQIINNTDKYRQWCKEQTNVMKAQRKKEQVS